MKTKIQKMTTEEFVKWMNEEFLDPYEHGRFSRIHKMNDDKYWAEYLRPLGCEIASGVENGVISGSFSSNEQYVQYIDDNSRFISFDSKEQFFNEVYPLDAIIEEYFYRQ